MVDIALRTTAAVLFAVLGFVVVMRAAGETTEARERALQKIVEVRAQPDQVSGVLVNLSSKPARNVEIRIDRSIPFTYRPESPLPQRSDGRFETSVSVVGLEQTD